MLGTIANSGSAYVMCRWWTGVSVCEWVSVWVWLQAKSLNLASVQNEMNINEVNFIERALRLFCCCSMCASSGWDRSSCFRVVEPKIPWLFLTFVSLASSTLILLVCTLQYTILPEFWIVYLYDTIPIYIILNTQYTHFVSTDLPWAKALPAPVCVPAISMLASYAISYNGDTFQSFAKVYLFKQTLPPPSIQCQRQNS